jgi:hypothetical protein
LQGLSHLIIVVVTVVVVLVVVVVIIVVGGDVVRMKSVKGLIGNGVDVIRKVGATVRVVRMGMDGGEDGVVDGSGQTQTHEQGLHVVDGLPVVPVVGVPVVVADGEGVVVVVDVGGSVVDVGGSVVDVGGSVVDAVEPL